MPKYLIINKEEGPCNTHLWAGYNSHSDAYEVGSVEEAVDCYLSDEPNMIGSTIMVAQSEKLAFPDEHEGEIFTRWVYGPFLIKPKSPLVEYDLVEV